MFKKTIISEFFTTLSFSQALQSLYLSTFWLYKLRYWKDRELFEKELLKYIDKSDKKVISFYNWRSAIFHTLKLIWVKENDEVIVNAYNCVSVSNTVIQSWAKIIYSDIEKDTLSFDYKKLEEKITKNTKVIILQHTFWKQAKYYHLILEIAKKKWLIVIEDCAHSIGLEVNNPNKRLENNYWDFLVFSTGRDKVISSVTWWFLIINNEKYFNKVDDIKKSLKTPGFKLILQNLMYNMAWFEAYISYDLFNIWRIVIYTSRKLKLITEILTPSEKACNFNNFFMYYPNSLAYLARKQLKKLDSYTKKRLENSKYYLENINNKKIQFIFNIDDLENYNWFRFPILLETKEEKDKLYKIWRENKIIFWNQWSGQNIIPIWTDLDKAWYSSWSCPIGEDISKRVITIPNHNQITLKDLKRIVEVLNNFKN